MEVKLGIQLYLESFLSSYNDLRAMDAVAENSNLSGASLSLEIKIFDVPKRSSYIVLGVILRSLPKKAFKCFFFFSFRNCG